MKRFRVSGATARALDKLKLEPAALMELNSRVRATFELIAARNE